MRIRWTSILFVVGACHVEASCGSTKELDMAKVTAFVTETLEGELGQKPEVVCPSSVKSKKGNTFECTVRFAPAPATATVVIVIEDDRGTPSMKPTTGFIASSKLEKQIADHFGKQSNTHVVAACGDRARVAVAGATFQCDIKDDAGSTAKVNVSVKDAKGALELNLAE